MMEKGQLLTGTAPELLKAYGATNSNLVDLGGIMRKFLDDKGFNLGVMRELAFSNQLGSMINNFLTRQPEDGESRIILNYFGKSLASRKPGAGITGYRGLHSQNLEIDKALASNPELRRNQNVFFGEGMSTYFSTSFFLNDINARVMPIAVIGYGAAGILVAHALRSIGFGNITVFEKAQETLGIWKLKNVYGKSRNNPRRIQFFDRTLNPAPGDGLEVKNFLQRLSDASVTHTGVTGVRPGNLAHTLKLADGRDKKFPIVINAIGLGKPTKLSDSSRMTTTATTTQCGLRWQQDITSDRSESKKIDGKRLVFIGLGNSTAEMLRQVHTLIDQGYDIDYRVLTHYPKDSVFNPDDQVIHEGKQYRVFRDTSKPNLVDFQGDLPDSRYDYYRALRFGKILFGVKSWSISEANILTALNQQGRVLESLKCDRLYTLTGYKHTKESLTPMGCQWDDNLNCALFDYDGEMIADRTASDTNVRLHKGYFGFGSVLETPYNQNAIVIPGMVHRIGDLLFSVCVRAMEYARK